MNVDFSELGALLDREPHLPAVLRGEGIRDPGLALLFFELRRATFPARVKAELLSGLRDAGERTSEELRTGGAAMVDMFLELNERLFVAHKGGVDLRPLAFLNLAALPVGFWSTALEDVEAPHLRLVLSFAGTDHHVVARLLQRIALDQIRDGHERFTWEHARHLLRHARELEHWYHQVADRLEGKATTTRRRL